MFRGGSANLRVGRRARRRRSCEQPSRPERRSAGGLPFEVVCAQHHTEGAPSLRSLQGRVAMLPVREVFTFDARNRGSRPFGFAQGRLFAQNAKGWGTLCVGGAGRNQKPGPPPRIKKLVFYRSSPESIGYMISPKSPTPRQVRNGHSACNQRTLLFSRHQS
jgi:hypothetical protein